MQYVQINRDVFKSDNPPGKPKNRSQVRSQVSGLREPVLVRGLFVLYEAPQTRDQGPETSPSSHSTGRVQSFLSNVKESTAACIPTPTSSRGLSTSSSSRPCPLEVDARLGDQPAHPANLEWGTGGEPRVALSPPSTDS